MDPTTLLDSIAKIAYSSRATVEQTYHLSGKCLKNNIPGHFIETGVGAGAQLCAMWLALKNFQQSYPQSIDTHHILGFDSFEGIPLAGPKDTVQPGKSSIDHDVNQDPEKLLVSSGITVHSREQVFQNILKIFGPNPHPIFLFPGWFEHSIPEFVKEANDPGKPNKFAVSLLRMDGDLYSSTKVVLEKLFPFVSDGGIIIVDDYELDGCRTALYEYFDQINWKPKKLLRIPGEFPVYFRKE